PPLLSVTVVFAGLAASPAHGSCQIRNVATLPVEIDTNQLLTRGAIDGKPVRVLIDTGSYMSLIWRSAAETLGLRLIGARACDCSGWAESPLLMRPSSTNCRCNPLGSKTNGLPWPEIGRAALI